MYGHNARNAVNVEYKVNAEVSADQFIHLMRTSSLGERRPVGDRACMAGMIANSNLVVSAWCGDELVGIARSMTDFHYACYLSDLAVAEPHQRAGVGKRLLAITQQQLGSRCKLILIAAPAADDYYEPLGFTRNSRCWVSEKS